MRWVVLADDWPPQRGGVATWGYGAAAGLAARGDRVRVFARARPGLVAPPGVELTPVPGRSFGALGPWWAAVRGAPALASADAVLATTWPMAEAVRGWMERREVPVHVVLHGSDLTRVAGREARLRTVCGGVTRCWAVSRYLVDLAARHGVGARWIPSPVEVREVSWSADGPWAFVGRATALKGGDRFVRLVARAGSRGIAIGEGSELGRWQELAQGADIRFAGALDRVEMERALHGAALVALFPRAHADGSGAEGLGLVLLEAAARGQLPLGADVGGVREAVGPGLCLDPEAEDAPGQIGRALAAWEPELGREWIRSVHGRDRVAAALRGE